MWPRLPTHHASLKVLTLFVHILAIMYVHNTSRSVNRGFTLIEILVVIGMLAILATVVLVAINPLRQFAQARNSQRQANVSAILNAVSQRIAENHGIFTDTSTCSNALPTTATTMSKTGGYDIRPCLVPAYISDLPFDPASGSNTCSTDASCATGSYSTGYTIQQESGGTRITVCAPSAAESALSESSAFCLSR